MKFKEKRMTKAAIEAAMQRRIAMFQGMTKEEIQCTKPVNKGYLYEYKNAYAENWGLFIPECVVCGETHRHGNGGSGFYSVHCNSQYTNDEPTPLQYEIVMDMNDMDNQILCERYGVQ